VRFLLACLVVSTLSFTNAFGQGSKMKSPYDPIEEGDKDRPDLRDQWMMRGREAPKGKSAAELRLKAHQHKMAMRAAREAAAMKAAAPGQNAPAITNWVPLGPAPLPTWAGQSYGNVTGRVTSVAMDPSDTSGNTVYAGGAYGGVWKSTNAAGPLGSVTWMPVTDQQASLATGAVSVQPVAVNPVVLVGTGEPNNAIDSYYGVGILRSIDGGANWTLIQSADGGAHPFAGLGVAKFAWSTTNTSIVVAATATTAKGFEEGNITGSTNRGLYQSSDGGQTWSFQSLPDSGPISATDVVYDATGGKFVAIVRNHGLYTSPNGTNWVRMTSQPPSLTATCSANGTCPMYRGQLAVAPSRDELYLWFISIDVNNNLVDQGIWRSINGAAWAQISENGLNTCPDGGGCFMDQTFYNMEVAAIPNGASTTDVYVGGVNLFKCKLPNSSTSCSTLDANFANQWINLTHVYGCNPTANISHVHPDEHGLDFRVIGGKAVMFFGNDGGVYRALDGFAGLKSGTCTSPNNSAGIGFENLNNGTLGSMTQFVSFSIHPSDQNTILGGTQDNGSPAATNATANPPTWYTANFGDGGDNEINPTNTAQWFTSYPLQQSVGVAITACNTAPSCAPPDFFNNLVISSSNLGNDLSAFYTPYILDPQNSGQMLVGTCRVWRGSSAGGAFSALSPNFDTGATGNLGTCSGQEFNLVRGLSAGGSLPPSLSPVVYATSEGTGPNGGFVGGEVWATTNAATTLMSNVTGGINPKNYTISSVAIDKSVANGQTAYVGIMGFGVSHVFKTANAGGSWTDWTGTGLPDSPVNALVVDSSVNPSQIYAGTDVGVFVSSTSSAVWTEVGPAPGSGQSGYLPNVPVSAIRLFNPSGGPKKLRVSTYGRGIWEFDLASAAPDYQISTTNSPLTVLRNQTATFNGKLTAVGGYNSPVTLSCGSGAPGTCTFSPSNVITPIPTGKAFTVAMPSGATITNYSFNIHGSDGTITHDAPVVLQVTDFSLGVPNPATVTAQQGGTSNATQYPLGSLGPFNGTVNLSCSISGTPAGASCGFSPSIAINLNPANPSVNVSTTVATTASTPVGSYTVTISAVTAGEAAKTQTLQLTVTAPPDFTWVINGSNAKTVLAGQSATYSLTATPLGSGTFTSDVTISCGSTNPALTTCGFDKQIHAGDPATTVMLTITTTGPNTGTVSPRRADNRGPWLPLTLPLAGVLMTGMAARRLSRHSARAGLCVSLVLLGLLIACGGGGSSGPPPPPPISVTVGPGVPTSVFPNNANWPSQMAQFTATVNNTSNKTVTWGVTGAPANGTIDANGLYTAPTWAPGLPATVNITATSQADPTKSGSRSETLSVTTALGTYTVTVTATEGVVSHSQNVSLTVN